MNGWVIGLLLILGSSLPVLGSLVFTGKTQRWLQAIGVVMLACGLCCFAFLKGPGQ